MQQQKYMTFVPFEIGDTVRLKGEHTKPPKERAGKMKVIDILVTHSARTRETDTKIVVKAFNHLEVSFRPEQLERVLNQ